MNSLLRQQFLCRRIVQSALPIVSRARYQYRRSSNHHQSEYNQYQNTSGYSFNKSHILYGGAFAVAISGVYEKANDWRLHRKEKKEETQFTSPLQQFKKYFAFKTHTVSNTEDHDERKQWIYSFKQGGKEMRQELGGKGCNLAEMTKLGIRIPPGFTISTSVCDYYNKHNGSYPNGLMESIFNASNGALKYIENELSNTSSFGNDFNPLLLSVRSGAAVSMPGMMDTVLNLGLNDQSVEALAKLTHNKRFALDSYRRLIQMFGNVVKEIDASCFEEELDKIKVANNYECDTQLTISDLQQLITKYKAVYKRFDPQHEAFPQDAKQQLTMAIEAVFGSWNTPRAVAYRNINHLNDCGLLGTAVNVQAMVFGNQGNTSGTGVCFTRNPSDGSNEFFGEFLMNAQGEDVVSGIRTPLSIDELAVIMPDVYDELVAIYKQLELHFHDMQDMEFTIEDGTLYILQTRTGKRSIRAAVKMAVDMVHEGLIDKRTAVMRINADNVEQLLHKQFDDRVLSVTPVMASGLPASPGVAVGQIVFDATKALEWHKLGRKVILVRNETSPEDIMGMNVAQGVLTIHGGMTSHAAVVARGMGTCCVAGCSHAQIRDDDKTIRFDDGTVLKEGEVISLDGTKGHVYAGQMTVIDVNLDDLMQSEFGELLQWAKEYKSLGVCANADNPRDAHTALALGAEGIGLTRTEHMFFSRDRIKYMREMILTDKREILDQLMQYQKEDFIGIYRAMKDKQVVIRLLDPPLHEFLPLDMARAEKQVICNELSLTMRALDDRMNELHETNPMLGHRGCRLGITHPEITEMQVTAIMEAAKHVSNELGCTIKPEIMVPLIGHKKELLLQKEIIERVADGYAPMEYSVGTMIEVPRAALTADEISPHVDFFSFGTNDLTQMTCGFSRDDAQSSFLGDYVDKFGIYEYDPFEVLDDDGVGRIIRMAVDAGRSNNPELEIGICGEHGGNPHSIHFVNQNGFDYVSCSPFRVPVAILSAAQAQIKMENQMKEIEK
eukprot:74037_1